MTQLHCITSISHHGKEGASNLSKYHSVRTEHLGSDEALAIDLLVNMDQYGHKETISFQPETYRDFTDTDISEIQVILGSNRRLVDYSFPIKLYSLLQRSETDGYSNTISWVNHGRAFKISDQNIFVKNIMPMYFYQTKWSSFIRQLSTYGFVRISGPGNKDKCAYYNELFLRGREELCYWIPRKKKRSLVIAPDDEPDLSKFKPMAYSLETTSKSKPVICKQQMNHHHLQKHKNNLACKNTRQYNTMRAISAQSKSTYSQHEQSMSQNGHFYPRKSLLESIVKNYRR